jgi:hypothetical protein
MKIFKLNNKNNLSAHDRPFYPSSYNIELVENPEEADYILLSPHPKEYINQIKNYSKYKNKMVVWVNNDNPDFLDDLDGVKYKFIAQPSGKKIKHITVPLVMTDHILWHLDEDFKNKCRSQKKIYDYCFMGQVYGKRKVLSTLKLDNYLFRQTGSIYFMNDKQKHESIKSFLLELSKCKFAFTPRGSGSNSFRLYESLMVGTVPISTDVIEYPFEEEANWDNFSIRGNMDSINQLISKSEKIDYVSFRNKGIEFWENYVKMDVLYDKIINTINEN